MKIFDWYVDKKGFIAFIRDDAELDPLGPTNSPILYARTFQEAYELLALTESLSDAWHVVDDKLEPAVPIYLVIDHSDTITTHWGTALSTWYRVGNPWGTIFATTDLNRARDHARNNRYKHTHQNIVEIYHRNLRRSKRLLETGCLSGPTLFLPQPHHGVLDCNAATDDLFKPRSPPSRRAYRCASEQSPHSGWQETPKVNRLRLAKPCWAQTQRAPEQDILFQDTTTFDLFRPTFLDAGFLRSLPPHFHHSGVARCQNGTISQVRGAERVHLPAPRLEAVKQYFVGGALGPLARASPCRYLGATAAMGGRGQARQRRGSLLPRGLAFAALRGGVWLDRGGVVRVDKRPVVLAQAVDGRAAVGDEGDDGPRRRDGAESDGGGVDWTASGTSSAESALAMKIPPVGGGPQSFGFVVRHGVRRQQRLDVIRSRVRFEEHVGFDQSLDIHRASSLLNRAPMFSSFAVVPQPVPRRRAQSQAKYREAHRTEEREKARARMHRLRELRKASENLRASPLFARYRLHVQRHLGVINQHRDDPTWLAALERFRYRDAERPYDREDAMFILQSETEEPRTDITAAEIDAAVLQLNRCTLELAFDREDPMKERAWRKISRGRVSGVDLDDESLEFMFRHAIPSPTFENMDACGCT
ncbi:hypothetical protein C8R46DRAFT_1046672 [Mycena filopes]|nr:hypothetical protein C8R46DRAFT_1046672 [Mycena filopes]